MLCLVLVVMAPTALAQADAGFDAADVAAAETSPFAGGPEGRKLETDLPPRKPIATGKSIPYARDRKKKKKSWLSMLGGVDKDGQPLPMKLPKLTTEEILTGVFGIAIVGLFLSFNI